MSDLKAKDLIQAKVLGCLDSDDETAFAKMMKDDQEFPWEEFGEYQNLVACLPTMLDFESPDPEVKNDIAKKLLELKEQMKTNESVDEKPEILEEEKPASLETVGDTDVIIEEESIEPDITVNSELVAEDENKEITFKQHELLHDTLKNKVKTTTEVPKRSEEKIIGKTSLSSPEDKLKRRNVKSHISKSPAYIEPPVQAENNKGKFIAIFLFIIALIAIIIVYFSLSADIQNNKDEIEKLKEQLYSCRTIDNHHLNG